MKIKAGLGYDLHRLEKRRKLYLGGVDIPFSKGLVGHSDGDCLIHAIIDSLLGALAEGDIGQFFPETDPQYEDIRSTELLKEVIKRIKEKDMEVIHLDAVVIAEEPKLFPHISRMKEILCSIIGLEKDSLGIKAKTNEGLGLIGKKKAMAAWAVALLRTRDS